MASVVPGRLFFKGLGDEISLIHHENIPVPAGLVSFLEAIRSCSLKRHLTPVGCGETLCTSEETFEIHAAESCAELLFRGQPMDSVLSFKFALMVVGVEMKESQLEGSCNVAGFGNYEYSCLTVKLQIIYSILFNCHFCFMTTNRV